MWFWRLVTGVLAELLCKSPEAGTFCFLIRICVVTVRVKGRMSLLNGMWHGLRNDIIMRNVIYAEWLKRNKSNCKVHLFWHPSVCKSSDSFNVAGSTTMTIKNCQEGVLDFFSSLSLFRTATCRFYLALINRARSLYGRILTEVASTHRTQWGLYQRPRSRFSHTNRPCSVNKMFIIWPNKKAKEQKHK